MKNVLVLYEIANKASLVNSKKAYREFERWAISVIAHYKDAAVQKVINSHLFRLRQELAV